MPTLALLKDCTGCAACYNKCPTDSIKMIADKRGFLHPVVSSVSCIECKLCEKVCPILIEYLKSDNYQPQVYAGWHSDKTIRMASSSGGAFSALAEKILDRGGVIYGAAWDGPRKVCHIRVDSIDDLGKLRKSKYIPSEISDSLSNVRTDLRSGREVLFSGTPCQIAGLYAFLGNANSSLLTTIDFICHGVPSPAVYNDYLDYLEAHSHARVRNVDFRDKKLGVECNLLFKVVYDNGSQQEYMFGENSFYRAFVGNTCLRESCYNCHFNELPRKADISLADFRGLGEKSNFYAINERHLGFTGIIVNTLKGQKLLEVSPNLICAKRPESELFNSQPHLRHPAVPSSCKEKFWCDFRQIPYEELAERYLGMTLKSRIINGIRVILRPRLYYFMGRLAKKCYKLILTT